MNQQVASLFELYLGRSDLRPASIRFKRNALRYFVEWFGDLPVGQVTAAIAEDYRNMLIGVPSPRSGRNRSKSCANGFIANFKPFFSWLRKRDYIKSNPFDGIRLYKVTKPKRETFSADELGRMVRIASPRWKVKMCMGLLGCRRGELWNICVRDIILSGRYPHVLIRPKAASKNTWPWGVKSHKIRMVGLPDVMPIGCETVELHNEIVMLMNQLPTDQPYVILEEKYYRRMIKRQETGELMDKHASDPTGNMQRSFRSLQTRAEVWPLRRFHELRAAFLTAMIKEHGLCMAADAAGHVSIETTREYDRRSDDQLVADIVDLTKKCYVS